MSSRWLSLPVVATLASCVLESGVPVGWDDAAVEAPDDAGASCYVESIGFHADFAGLINDKIECSYSYDGFDQMISFDEQCNVVSDYGIPGECVLDFLGSSFRDPLRIHCRRKVPTAFGIYYFTDRTFIFHEGAGFYVVWVDGYDYFKCTYNFWLNEIEFKYREQE